MTLPNFLIIGAPKSGTSSIYEYLRQHPQVYMSPEKETNFFAFHGNRPNFGGPGDKWRKYATCPVTLEAYEALFHGVTDERAVGEASPMYLSHPRAPEEIRKHLPDARLIAILRNPADRAFSAYMMRVRDGLERSADFAEALRREPQRIRDNWSWGDYARKGFYYEHLKRYFDRFDRSRIRVYLFEDLTRHPLQTMQDIFQFLEIDDGFVPDMSRKHNVSGVIKSPVSRFLWTRSHALRAVVRPLLTPKLRHGVFQYVIRDLVKSSMPAQLRRELLERFRPDILKLEELLQRDLTTAWLQEQQPSRAAQDTVAETAAATQSSHAARRGRSETGALGSEEARSDKVGAAPVLAPSINSPIRASCTR